ASDALRDVKKQYQRNRNLWDHDPASLPVFGTVASRFNDPGINALYAALIKAVNEDAGAPADDRQEAVTAPEMPDRLKNDVIPPARSRYLAEIVASHREYTRWAEKQCELARQLYQLIGVPGLIPESPEEPRKESREEPRKELGEEPRK